MENFKKEKVSLWRRIAALALAAALALGLAACDASAVVPGSSTPTVSTVQPAGDGQTANFEMHFLDVGQALSVLVECDGQYMLYDGGNVDDGSYVVSYLQNLGVEGLQYVFCSHAHEDHVGGLAAVVDAMASAVMEELCNALEAEIRTSVQAQGHYLTGRFSPGYGDCPLTLQQPFAIALDTVRGLGMAVTPENLLTPRKSVTAILGVADHPVTGARAGCGHCLLREKCEYRKRGTTCEN